MKNLKNILSLNELWKYLRVALLGLMAFVLILSFQDKKRSTLKTVLIEIEPLADNKLLINNENVLDLIKRYQGFDIVDTDFDQLDIHALEKLISKDRRIAKADVFVDKHNRIHLEIKQKEPVIRVESNAGAYYLDKYGDYIPAVPKVAIRVPVATGDFGAYNAEEILKKGTPLNGLMELANYIKKDEFLSSLVEQIDLDKRGELTLVPKVGRNKIVFGSIEDMEDKFYRLKVYYKEGVQQVGLDKFSILNLKYENQLVGVKKTG